MLGRLLAVYCVLLAHGMLISAFVSLGLSRNLPNGILRSSLRLRGRYNTKAWSSAETPEVSKHFRVDPEQLLNVLKKFGTDIREKPDGQYELKECKLCSKRNRDKPDNLWKLNVWPSGSFHCFRCSSKGNWLNLKEKSISIDCEGSASQEVKVFNVGGGKAGSTANENKKGKAPYVIPSQFISSKAFYSLFPEESRKPVKETELEASRRKQVKDYLNTVRGLNDEVLKKYNIGYTVQQYLSNENEWVDHVCITFPWQVRPDVLEGKELKFTSAGDATATRESTIVRIKYR